MSVTLPQERGILNNMEAGSNHGGDYNIIVSSQVASYP